MTRPPIEKPGVHPDEEVATAAAPPAPYGHLCARILLKSFWEFADHAVFLAMANLVTLGLVVTVVGAPFGLGGMLECAAVAARHREPTWDDYRRGARRNALAAFVMVVGGALLVASPVVGAFLYPHRLGMPGYFLAGLNLWLCALLLPLLLLTIPGMVLHGATARDAVRMAAACVFLHPLAALFALVWLAILLVASIVGFPLMLPFVSFAAFGVGLMAAWVVPMRSHLRPPGSEDGDAAAAASSQGAEAGAVDGAANGRPHRPRTWAEKKRQQQEATAAREAAQLPYMERDETTRTLREFFRPWES